MTRIARLTGLDRTRVEVASAIRPRGHVLQATAGKGLAFEDAALGALMEAAELHGAERLRAGPWGSARELGAAGRGAVVSPRELDPEGEPSWDDVRIAWREGTDLLGGGRALVPAHAIHVPPAGGPILGPALVRWTSNGMGAAPRREAALLHAVLEVLERDRLARALPEGFTDREIGRRMIDPRTLGRAAPRAARLVGDLEGRGFRVHLFDLDDPGLPCAAALVVDPHLGAVPVAAGYACRLGRDGALVAALLEAAQSRATEIHGAREDVAFGDRRAAVDLARRCAGARPRRDARRMPDRRARTAKAGLAAAAARLRRAGVRRAIAVDLDGPPGVAVVKVVVPGLLLSELL